jgi:hypothetical protein
MRHHEMSFFSSAYEDAMRGQTTCGYDDAKNCVPNQGMWAFILKTSVGRETQPGAG